MSRNLCTSTCPDCGEHTVKLTDILGKPLEARRYGPYAPSFGTRWDCPCGVAYFVIIRQGDKFWAQPEDALRDESIMGGYPNREKGRFIVKHPAMPFLNLEERWEQTGYFVLDLSYYESFNDEHGDPNSDAEPRHLLKDDAAEVQWVW